MYYFRSTICNVSTSVTACGGKQKVRGGVGLDAFQFSWSWCGCVMIIVVGERVGATVSVLTEMCLWHGKNTTRRRVLVPLDTSQEENEGVHDARTPGAR